MKLLTTFAVAAAGAIATTMLSAAPASAAARCDGSQVRTCVNMIPAGAYYFTPRATITDMAGDSRDYRVAVMSLEMQQKKGTRWVQLGSLIKDADGFHGFEDVAEGNRGYCKGYGTITVRTRAHFRFDNFTTITNQYRTSDPVTLNCWPA